MHRHCMIEEQLFNPKWLFSPFFSWVSAVAVIWLLFLFVPDLLSALLCFLEESISYGAMPRPLVCNLLRMYPCLWTPLYMEEFFPALAAAGNLHCSISQEGKYCFTIIKANKCLQMGQLVLSCVSIKCDLFPPAGLCFKCYFLYFGCSLQYYNLILRATYSVLWFSF